VDNPRRLRSSSAPPIIPIQCLSVRGDRELIKPDKLRNLLVELETRVDRLERSYSRTNLTTGSPLVALRAEVRRHLAKVDSLRAGDVASLEAMAAKIPIPAGHQSLDNLILGLKIGLNQLGPDELLEALPGQRLQRFILPSMTTH